MSHSASARRCVAVALAASWLFAGCAGHLPSHTGSTRALAAVSAPLLAGNQLVNPGLEQALDQNDNGWGRMGKTKWFGFDVVESPTHSGNRSAHVGVSWQPGEREKAVRVAGLVQELSPTRFPTRLGGWFRVEKWENASEETDMYLQAVVIVIGDPRTREIVEGATPNLTNYQIRYFLGGVTEFPFEISNAKLEMVRSGPPPIGEWVYFEMPLRDDFESMWGVVPANYDVLRVFFELRWDNKETGVGLSADIYYDDLFLGFEPWP